MNKLCIFPHRWGTGDWQPSSQHFKVINYFVSFDIVVFGNPKRPDNSLLGDTFLCMAAFHSKMWILKEVQCSRMNCYAVKVCFSHASIVFLSYREVSYWFRVILIPVTPLCLQISVPTKSPQLNPSIPPILPALGNWTSSVLQSILLGRLILYIFLKNILVRFCLRLKPKLTPLWTFSALLLYEFQFICVLYLVKCFGSLNNAFL